MYIFQIFKIKRVEPLYAPQFDKYLSQIGSTLEFHKTRNRMERIEHYC